MKNKKILVIGGAGFIGSHLVDALADQNDSDITIIDDLSTGKFENIGSPDVSFIKADIGLFKSKEKYDVVFVLANDNKNNQRIIKKSLKLLKGDGVIFYTSSYKVYGGGLSLSENNNQPQPLTSYGRSKLECEELIKKHTDRYFILRLGNVFGERQRPDGECGIIAVMKDALLCNKIINLYNQGKNVRDYVFIDDVINSIFLLKEFGTYNIGTTIGHKTIDLINRVGVNYKDAENREYEDKITLNTEKIQKTGWQPKVSVLQYLDEIKKQYLFYWEQKS